jgi:menaquinone-9 beta-reductase
MDRCDVLIVGGGPAGSSCAWGLRHSGLDVVILDKQVFPRDKVCGGWITPAVLSKLEVDADDYGQGRTLQPISGFRAGCIGAEPIGTAYGKTVSYGIRRREFDAYLLERTAARRLLGTPLTSLVREGEGWVVNGQWRARLVVGAGGHFCPVARWMGGSAREESPVVAQEVEFPLTEAQRAGCRIDGQTPQLYFCPDMKGYGWCFRKGDVLNVGLGRADAGSLPSHVARFVEFLKRMGRVGFALPPLKGHAYLLRGTSPRMPVADGLLLVGDAAGLAHAQSGEGILPAIASGLAAARTILDANGCYAQRRLQAYRERLAVEAPSLWLAMGRHVPPACVEVAARALLRVPWFVREVVLNQWFLHAGEAAR